MRGREAPVIAVSAADRYAIQEQAEHDERHREGKRYVEMQLGVHAVAQAAMASSSRPREPASSTSRVTKDFPIPRASRR